jgi:hypothetical protein
MHRFAGQMMLSQRPELRSAMPVPEGLSPHAMLAVEAEYESEERLPTPISGNVGVSLTRTETEPTEDLPLWTLIRNSTEAMSFTITCISWTACFAATWPMCAVSSRSVS